MIRFHARQKGRFRLALKAGFEEMGYRPRMEIHRCLGKNRNVIVGDLGKAKVIFTAHYDTPSRMFVPNFITPRSVLLSVLYQLLIVVLMLAGFYLFLLAGGYAGAFFAALVTSGDTPFLANFVSTLADSGTNEAALTFTTIGGYVAIFLLGYWILGVPNRNNYNDNTSGVVTLLEIAAKLPADLHKDAAFVFFDREEWGSLGSLGFKKRYAKLLTNTPVINFDCVGDGETLAFLFKKAVSGEIREKLKAADTGERKIVYFPSKTTFYPSDHMNFKRGIGVAAFRKNRVWGYCLGRIHTRRDRILNEENITALSDMMTRFLEAMR